MKIEQTKVLSPGMRIIFKYEHWTNSISCSLMSKKGQLIRAIRNKQNLDRPTGYWMVQIEGNKNPSRIDERQLSIDEKYYNNIDSPPPPKNMNNT